MASVITFVIPEPQDDERATMTISRELACRDFVLTPLQEVGVDSLVSQILHEHR